MDYYKEYMRIGSVVRGIEVLLSDFAKESTSERSRASIKNEILSRLRSEKGAYVPPQLRDRIRSLWTESEWNVREGSFVQYRPFEPEKGKAFGLFYARSSNGQSIGSPARFVVGRSAVMLNDAEQVIEVLNDFRQFFSVSKEVCRSIITPAVSKNVGFAPRVVNSYQLSLDRGPGEGLPLVYSGASAGLAIGVALFSAVTGLPVPAIFAFTGQLSSDGKVSWVSDVEAKLDGVFSELPQVETVIVPEDCRHQLQKDDRVQFVTTFEQTLNIIFPDWKTKMASIQLPGQVQYSWQTVVSNGIPLKKLKVEYDENLDPQVIENLRFTDIDIPRPGRGIIIHGAKPAWLVSALVAELKNIASFVAVFDPTPPSVNPPPGGESAIIVSVKTPDDCFRVRGQVIHYKPGVS